MEQASNEISIDAVQRCRSCLTTDEVDFHSLREKFELIDGKVHNLLELLQVCASVQVSFNDGLPQLICQKCLDLATSAYQFRILCERADSQLWMEIKDTVDTELQLQCVPAEKDKIETDNHTTKEEKPARSHTCDQCGKQFKYQASVLKHRCKHDVAHRSCMYCNESLSSAKSLARHMDEMHAHLKTVKCSICSKAFFKQANLKLHMSNVHSGIKRHMCEVCGISFALAGNLATHRRLHTGAKPYTCAQCGRGFVQQAALRSHEAGHSDRKDHVCAQCGAAFSRAGALRNHCKRHSSVRSFACELCNKAFTFSSERKRHMTIHTGEKKFECDVCGSRFNRSANLAVHHRIHTGDMPHACSICGRRFSQAHCLQTHIATHSYAV